MRITIPDLQDRLAALELKPDTFSTIEIHFGNGFIKWFRIGGSADFYYYSYSDYNSSYDPMKIDGDSVLLILFMPEQYSADDIGAVEVSGDNASDLDSGGYTSITFSNNDIMVPFNELVPITKLSEFVFDPTAIILSATNSGDGTMSFVYKDMSIKPTYIMPWEWIEESYTEISPSADMSFIANWRITGIIDFYGEPCVGGFFSIDRGMGYGGYDTWDYMTLDLEKDILRRDPQDMQISIDETGLTAVWTESFLPGYGFDDIIGFFVEIDYVMQDFAHDPKRFI